MNKTQVLSHFQNIYNISRNTISCHKFFTFTTLCDLFILGLLFLCFGRSMFNDIISKPGTSKDRVTIAAELSVMWHLATIIMYMGKSEMWKYAFAFSLFLSGFALLGQLRDPISYVSSKKFFLHQRQVDQDNSRKEII
ncbi:similar to Saccharomyces cerevisiae YOL117W RRI2 Subunit of the COP9 signalosome (CSN) complex that cleaves the ubiquitin-like protein Nedd8 from SCF ubiquitin ligases [Maudiozyma saulgeensis]|uniref:Similar to Saccharomyces cerevisiae YOL117W RRI2 Subunit of the COP9 signalosome (CSN) complex that cleaves the ubiquitin-like protein Nedd8 from SCF ubiquitin ligases n=1 Tax=Maudiozyma saulgeensis TaxID=1789683 RepID=A0A1X7R653_9SACH|nr:similar to Saccharomyces cerevisiae YOL117W RRI2 Subunit of the COP9 signalosome (CSN) complex that cleaves the ubiquitin-like protein Nedd8 from SCF ubiquitin ligases [Kazachstania saulgeensis]